MMVEAKTIGQSVLVGLIGILTMLGGAQISDNDAYFCQDKNLVMNCERLSKYYGLPNGKCISSNPDVGNKVCRSGWLEISDDTTIELNINEVQESGQVAYPGCDPLKENVGPIGKNERRIVRCK